MRDLFVSTSRACTLPRAADQHSRRDSPARRFPISGALSPDPEYFSRFKAPKPVGSTSTQPHSERSSSNPVVSSRLETVTDSTPGIDQAGDSHPFTGSHEPGVLPQKHLTFRRYNGHPAIPPARNTLYAQLS
nr:hypothetical protein L204_05253 [Cryptococcus depauperatus CBS 7855]